MKEHLPELLEIIRDEISFYRDLLECEQRKTTLLATGQLEELIECNKAEEDSIIRLHELEEKRLRLCEKFCEELQITREEFTLAHLAEFFDNPQEFDESAMLLRNVVQSVQVVGAHNRDLIEKPLRHVEGMLTIFSNAVGPYQPDGTFSAGASVYPTFSQNA